MLSADEVQRLRRAAADRRRPVSERLQAANVLHGHWHTAIEQLVAEARRAGLTWEQIGAALTMTKQAARSRFWGIDPTREQ